jgi:hypothetical protein
MQLDAQHTIKALARHFMRVDTRLNAGVVDQDVQPAQFLDRRLEHLEDIVFLRVVGLDQEVLAAVLLHLVHAWRGRPHESSRPRRHSCGS